MSNYLKIANFFIGKGNVSKVTGYVKKVTTKAKKMFFSKNQTKSVTNHVIVITDNSSKWIDFIAKYAKLPKSKSAKLFNYLPKEAQENFGTLLQAGKKLGYLQKGKNSEYTSESIQRFLKTLDKETYSKMLFLEKNFSGLNKSDFKKLLAAYKTSEKLMQNKANIQNWLKCKDKLYEYAKIIENEGIKEAKKCANEIKETIGIMTEYRAKGLESIYDKLSRKVLNGTPIESLEKARAKVGDLVGTRIVLDDISEKNIQKVVDNICKGIESGKIKITEIHNYHNGAKPYFSEAQFEQIRAAAAKKGYEIPRLESEQVSLSGYVSAQMNITHSNGISGELQIRSTLMNKYGEIEHIPYDIRRGKNISKNLPELEKLFAPVEDAVLKLKRNNLDKVYDNYILDCYKYIRKYELGKIKGVFNLPQMPASLKDYQILSFENLAKIHTTANEIKAAARTAQELAKIA